MLKNLENLLGGKKQSNNLISNNHHDGPSVNTRVVYVILPTIAPAQILCHLLQFSSMFSLMKGKLREHKFGDMVRTVKI